MEVGLVHKIDIDQEMQQAYLDYAMSVIVARALPDARDGLKPVHRRILYAMHDMNLRPDLPYKKSARIVGEVLGKYHPHGDMAVYEAMARMAQDFSLRYMLVDGQGNFGSVDGDPPAAMRYTEARLATLAAQMLADIGKNTVNFSDNFDGTLTEPTVLPSALPNLLVNGATGIAVGMATSIPPHNLGEIVDAMQHLLENWERLDDVSIEELLKYVQGPDFPTGGMIVQTAGGDGLASAYSTGRGQVTIQARTHLEEMDRGRSRIIITELPYMTNKSSLIERIADLVREEKIDGIADLRDESDRQGMRIVIELSKTADPEKTLRDLLKHTPMQTTFSIIMLALVDGEPRHLSLKQAMRVYLEHRLEIVRRRSQYDLDRARQRAHILEGLRVALKNLDEVIEIIRKSADVDTARARLMKRFKLTEIQTQAILDMPLRRLAALERKKIDEEYKETQAIIKGLESLLRSPKRMREVVGDELRVVKEQFGDRRRTHIIQLREGQTTASLLTAADTIPEKTVWLSITPNGLISRSMDETLPSLDGEAAPAWLFKASARDTLYLVSENGEAASVPVHAVPEATELLQGAPLNKISPLRETSRLAAAFTTPRGAKEAAKDGDSGDEKRFIVTVSRQGMVKKSPLAELPGPSANVFTLAKVNDEDRIGWAMVTNGLNELILVTAAGMAIRFKEEEVRSMGLAAAGVMGVKLAGNDELAGADIFDRPGDLVLITNTGKAKRVALAEFPLQGRYGQGVQAWKLHVGEQIIGAAIAKGGLPAVLHTEEAQPKGIRIDALPMQTRSGHGSSLQGHKGEAQLQRLTLPIIPAHLPAAEISQPASQTDGQPPAGKRAASAKKAPAAAKPTTESKAKSGAVKAGAKRRTATTSGPAQKEPAAKPAKPKQATPAAGTASKTAPVKSDKPASVKAGAGRPAKAAEAPAGKKAAKTPAAKTPAAKTPAAKTPAAKTPAAKSPAASAAPTPKPAEPGKPATGKTRAALRTEPETGEPKASKSPAQVEKTPRKKPPASEKAAEPAAASKKTGSRRAASKPGEAEPPAEKAKTESRSRKTGAQTAKPGAENTSAALPPAAAPPLPAKKTAKKTP